MKTLIAITFAAFLFAMSASAQTNPPSKPMQKSGTMDSSQQNDLKIAVLEKELEVSKEFMQHILATVYFCIGAIIVVLLAMVGFGWFQNIRAYERDKEVLRQALTTSLNEVITQKLKEFEKKATENFIEFDGKMANSLEKSFQQIYNLRVSLESSIFRVAHIPKTPRTDFMELLHQVHLGIGKISPTVLDNALSVIRDYLEKVERLNSAERTDLLKFIGSLPPGSMAYTERIRELLAAKPD